GLCLAVAVKDVQIDLVGRPEIGRASEVGINRVLSPRQITSGGGLVLVDAAQGMAELVEDHPVVLAVRGASIEPPVVHRRAALRDRERLGAYVGPRTGISE